MVQILPPGRQRQTLAQKLARGIGAGLESAEDLYQQNQAERRLVQENEAAKRLGIDLSGISDPKMREQALAETLKGQTEANKFKRKQETINEFLGNRPAEPKSKGQMLASQGREEVQNKFDPSLVSDEDILRAYQIDHDLGHALEVQKESALREKRAQKEFELKEKKSSPEYQREQHLESAQATADVKYNQQLEEASKQHALKEQTLNRLEQLNKKGVTGKPYEKLLEKAGLINLTSEGRREFAADVKNLITDIRSILGAQFTGFEFQTILNAYPSADFSQGANEAIIRNLKDFQDIKSKEVEIARRIKKENNGKIPPDFQSQVNEKVHEYAMSKIPSIKDNARKIMNEEYGIPKGHTLMLDKKGEPLSVPEDKVSELLENGLADLP